VSIDVSFYQNLMYQNGSDRLGLSQFKGLRGPLGFTSDL